jgi:RNA polymerase sigma-70 factor (ECF subfamily)
MAETGPNEDRLLLARCGRGEPEAFDELYRRHGDALYAIAWRMLRSPEEAEDVVQDVFVKLFHAAPKLRVDYPLAWLRRVTANLCIDRIRRRGRSELQLIPDLPLPAARESRGAGFDLQRAVRTLPDRARQIFLLHDVEGFKHREIAEMLEISEGTSKSQLFRARQMLRDALEGGAA